MIYRFLANGVVAVHLAFIIFAVAGGLFVLKWRRLVWLHLPACLWAALIELMGWLCPLTPLENWLRARGGTAGYRSSFVEHYLLPLIYPAALTRPQQIVLGLLVLGINLGIYGWLLSHWGKRRT